MYAYVETGEEEEEEEEIEEEGRPLRHWSCAVVADVGGPLAAGPSALRYISRSRNFSLCK